MSRSGVPLRIFVTGAGGQLGQVLLRELRRGGHEVAALTRAALDLTQREQVLERLVKLRPQAIVNTSAFGVEASEEDPKTALAVNAFAVRTLAEACRSADATLLHFSSDFVFDGTATSPYRETDRPNPGSVYGATKLLGEWYAEWGAAALRPARREPLRKPRRPEHDRPDVRGHPRGAHRERVLRPHGLPRLHDRRRGRDPAPPRGKAASGVYHCVNAGFTTWHELAVELTRQIGSPSSVVPVSADDLASKVSRPKFAALSNEKLANLGIELPSWQNALGRALAAPLPTATPIPPSGIRPTSSRG